MRVARSIAATVGLVLALGLDGCAKASDDDPAPPRVVGRVTTDAVTCPVGDVSCRTQGTVRWSVPVDLPVAVTASQEHSYIELLVPYDGTTPAPDWVDRPEDYLLVGTVGVVYLRANGQVTVVSADTGVVEDTVDAAGYEIPEPGPGRSTDPDQVRVDAGRLGLVVDDLIYADGWPVVDDVPLVVALGCAKTAMDPDRSASGGAPSYVGSCTTPVLFAVNL